MNFKLFLWAIRLKAVRSDVMFCSTGSEGHLVLFVPLDIGVCQNKEGSSVDRHALHTDPCNADLPK